MEEQLAKIAKMVHDTFPFAWADIDATYYGYYGNMHFHLYVHVLCRETDKSLMKYQGPLEGLREALEVAHETLSTPEG